MGEGSERADAGEPSEQGRVLSIVPPALVARLGGLPPEGIAGIIAGSDVSPEAFRPNPVFIELMHRVIEAAGPRDPEFRAAARVQGEGWIYVIDLRTPEGPQGQLPTRDIIGGFEVRSGDLVDGSYWRNEAHEVPSSSRNVSASTAVAGGGVN